MSKVCLIIIPKLLFNISWAILNYPEENLRTNLNKK